MIQSSSRVSRTVLNSRHRGFIKVALQTGAKLVPVFSFGERVIFDNFPTPTWMQLRAMKAMRANIFFLPYGQFLMSIPRQASIRLVVGKPIDVPIVPNPSDELINMLRDHYFTELLDLCEKTKERCDYPNEKVVVEPATERVTREEWQAKIVQLQNKCVEKIRAGSCEGEGEGEGGENQVDVVQYVDPLPTMKLEHVSWTSEGWFCAGFFVVTFGIIIHRSGLCS